MNNDPSTGIRCTICCVSATLAPVLDIDLDHLQEQHPKATRAQLVDELLALGIVEYHRRHQLPRPGSNPDEDG